MDEKKTEHLLKSYPKLYRNRMYFACGDGWFEIIDELSKNLEPLIEEIEGLDEVWMPYVTDVKEKWGTLRFYMSCETDKMSKFIREAELKSKVTCEACGSPGKIRGGHWIVTLCDKCDKKS